MSNVVYAIFRDEVMASRAIDTLEEAHFEDHEIGVLIHDGKQGSVTESLRVGVHTEIGRGATFGGVLGALTSAVVLGVSGIGIAPVLVLGTLAGCGVGALVGAFLGLGSWHDEIEFTGEALEHGAILINVWTTHRMADARDAFLAAGAEEVRVIMPDDEPTDGLAAARS